MYHYIAGYIATLTQQWWLFYTGTIERKEKTSPAKAELKNQKSNRSAKTVAELYKKKLDVLVGLFFKLFVYFSRLEISRLASMQNSTRARSKAVRGPKRH